MSNLTKLEGKRSHAEMAVTVATQVLGRPNLQTQTSANIRYQRGVARMQLEQFPQAVADFRRTLEISPQHLGARMALSDALLKTGDVDAAEESLDVAVATFPSSPIVFNNRGMFYQSQGAIEKAIGDFTQAVGIDPKYVQAYLNRGFTFIHSGDAQAAVADFDSVLDVQPNNASAFSLRGTARLRSGDPQGAIPDYTRAVELDPSNASARADLGFAYFFIGDYATAAAGFDQSLTLKPENAFLHPWRYVSLTRSGQQAKARQSYQGLTTRPLEQQSWFDALTLLLMGELTEDEVLGRVESRDVTLKDAQICEAYYFIGVTKQANNPEQAAAYFRRALRSQAKQLSAYQAAEIALNEIGAQRQ
jgi:tetratricopeptide (TPR) repeat protein